MISKYKILSNLSRKRLQSIATKKRMRGISRKKKSEIVLMLSRSRELSLSDVILNLQKHELLRVATTLDLETEGHTSQSLVESIQNFRQNQNLHKGKTITGYRLKRAVHSHLRKCGFHRNGTGYTIEESVTKENIRDLHLLRRQEVLARANSFLSERGDELINYFADGKQLEPEAIVPELIEVKSDTIESELFKLATLNWSIPVSSGFGRRLRFLVMDRFNDKLIGVFALGDPVFNLAARDNTIEWKPEDRCKRLSCIMDAYVVGAVPPYSQIIGGKLVAALIASQQVRAAFRRKYSKRRNDNNLPAIFPDLYLTTTTSALGRSSIYNRLKIPDGSSLLSIGMTKGYGHFHISDTIFEMMRKYLDDRDHPYASGYTFGMGPNWRIRVVRAALDSIQIQCKNILKHGIEREVFMMPLVKNWRALLLGKHVSLVGRPRSVEYISEYCLARWMIPRSQRDKTYRRFRAQTLLTRLLEESGQS